LKNSTFLIFLFIISVFVLISCNSRKPDNASAAVEGYINALVEKNADQLSTLSCADWEPTALTELDSFQAVTTRLENLDCQQTGTDGDKALVLCEGKIIATYGNEDQEIDLSARTYVLVNQGGEWLVCGER
jgi:hypothetical protein